MDAIQTWPPTDPVGEALHFLRVDGAFYCRSELTAPWGMTLDPMPGYLWFHVVTTGGALLQVDEEHSRWLHPGDVSLVPHGNGHILRSEPGVPAPGDPGARAPERPLRDPPPWRRRRRPHHPGLRRGPLRPPRRPQPRRDPAPLLYIQASDEPRASCMQSVFRLMAAEARTFRPGGEAVITRLGDVLVIQAIRAWIETAPAARTGWLGALQDPQIGQALALIHRDPSRPWTVASLAHELAMSRSAFAARFTQLVGEPAMQYLTRWRMQLAHHALQTGPTTVAELATRLGYRSEAAFARAFKRVMGVPPGAAKRGGEPLDQREAHPHSWVDADRRPPPASSPPACRTPWSSATPTATTGRPPRSWTARWPGPRTRRRWTWSRRSCTAPRAGAVPGVVPGRLRAGAADLDAVLSAG